MKLFSRNDFQHTIKDYCKHLRWNISEIDDNHATLIFTMSSGRNQALFIVPYQSTLEFSVPSIAQFNRVEEIPHMLSTKLLQRSSMKKFGFWSIEEIDGTYVYSYMHNAEMQLLNVEYFANVVQAMVEECEQFEQEWVRFLDQASNRR